MGPMTRSSRRLASFGLAAVLLASGCAEGRTVLKASAGPERVRPEALEVVWHARITEPPLLRYKPRERSQPVWDAARGWLFVADRFGVVHALDAAGRTRWTFQAAGAVEAGLVLDGDRLYVVSTGGHAYGLDPAEGTVLWDYKAATELATTPTLAGGKLLVPSLSNTLVALDAKSGKFLWFHRGPPPAKLTIHGAAGATVAGDRVLTAFSDGSVVCLGLADGAQQWTRTFGAKGEFVDIDSTPAVAGGRVYVASYGEGIYALDLATGDDVWSVDDVPGAVHVAAAGPNLLVTASGVVAAFRLTDGQRQWKVQLPGGGPTQPLVLGDTAFIGTDEGPLYGVSIGNGLPAVAFEAGPGIAAPPAPADGGLWVFSNGGTLYRLASR